MSNKAKPEPAVAETADGKSKTAKTKETMSFLSTLVPLLGVLGTAFVWAAANYYVGTVDIKPDGDYQDISVQVFDQKGVEQNFHTPHFLLQPGKYHMAINVDKKGVHHVDTEVKLGSTANIKIVEPKAPVESGSESNNESRKHWWQIWKKSNPDKTATDATAKSVAKTQDKSSAQSPEKSVTETPNKSTEFADPDTPVTKEIK
ncbi:MAG: hypothetical protein JST89_05085 [Cyanobacteria bacterium SZAS-4]|nr:hypothetical protein [Cyanobacteria bacterium SZAS-4]